MHIDMTRIGELVRRGREEREWTQTYLAEKIDVSIRTIIAIEKGRRNPTLEVFNRLVRTLDITTEPIFHPEKMSRSPDQEQFLFEAVSYSERERRIIRNLVRDMRRDDPDE